MPEKFILREDVGFRPYKIKADGTKEFIEKDVQPGGPVEYSYTMGKGPITKQTPIKAEGLSSCKEERS